MALTNTSKPSTSLANLAKVSFGETWATITTTWASETRTWLVIGSFISNLAKVAADLLIKEDGFYLLLEDGGRIPLESSVGGMTNIAKPI